MKLPIVLVAAAFPTTVLTAQSASTEGGLLGVGAGALTLGGLVWWVLSYLRKQNEELNRQLREREAKYVLSLETILERQEKASAAQSTSHIRAMRELARAIGRLPCSTRIEEPNDPEEGG